VKYRAVIFDLWQTLVPWDQEESTRFNTEVAKTIGVEPERYLEAWLTAQHLPNRNTGPAADHFRALFGELGVAASVDDVLAMRRDRARRVLVPRPDALPTLDELRRRGHLLGMISVCTQDVPEVWDDTPLGGKFDATVFSCDVGVSKPDPRIYEIACERLRVEPGECLFVGDGANDELPGAERAGMAAIQLRAPGEALTPDGEAWTGRSVEHLSDLLELPL
jgi:putative hydrolase of the HAD superfamily